MLAEVKGLYGIRAKVLAYSRSVVTDDHLITYEIEYPRMVLAELNTHGMLARNSASSRAIPFKKMMEQLIARPVRFGEANKGMQDKGEDFNGMVDIGPLLGLSHEHTVGPEEAWNIAKYKAMEAAEAFYKAGYHKQVYNRLVEPFQMMKTVLSGTELANYFWLRDHEAADPTIRELARVMYEAREQSTPFNMEPGQWHLPYINWLQRDDGVLYWQDEFGTFVPISAEDAIKVSVARCAAVSFRNVDYGIEKSREVWDRLVGDERKHASAFEHVATPMRRTRSVFSAESLLNVPWFCPSWEPGISHVDKDESLWSGKFKGFIQYRKLIPGENYK